jgi:DNA-binding winged helix-turn-helix (wHTH) protein
MAYKNSTALQHAQNQRLSAPGTVGGGNPNATPPFLMGGAEEIASLLALDDHLAVLREVLESDRYQVALVPRDQRIEWGHIRRSVADPFSTAASTVLLPFSWNELVARVSQFVRDAGALAGRQIARFEDVCVDFTRMQVSRSSGELISLTAQEFKTLKCFLSNPDRVLSRDQLLNEAWGYEQYPSTRTVDNHVFKLRQKLEKDPAHPVHFQTVHAIGYRFVP